MARKTHIVVISILLATSWILAFLIYTPGLKGPFLFDDFPNLEKIGALGPIKNWELFQAYISSGFSGPTGRPISLLSFLLNTNDWPADPEPFKQTNLLIHLLISVILFSTIRKLLVSISRSWHEANWIALIATTLWLLNPFLVSTTLYVIQRMTQLAALFSILGIWGYLQGRSWLSTRPYLGYITISFSVGLGTFLAVFSKENGVLLPLLILVIELTLAFHWKTPAPNWRWTIVFLGLPALVIIAYLATPLSHIASPIPTRNFSLLERLLTEPRILWDYLFHLFIPHIQTRGLYQDGIVVSKGFSTPWTTLTALLGLIILTIVGWLVRQRWPLVSLSILFFLAGHLLESTTIALELYFEHRNYLPAIFLFLPIGSALMALNERHKLALGTLAAIFIYGTYAIATWQGARLWGNENQLMLVWAEMNPLSPRAQSSAVQALLQMGKPSEAYVRMEQALRKIPDSSLLTSSYLSLKANLGVLNTSEFTELANRLRQQPFDAQMLRALEHLVDTLNTNAPLPEHSAIMMSLLSGLRDDLKGRVSVAHRYTYYLQALLLLDQCDGNKAYPYFKEALSHYRRVQTGLYIVSLLATRGYYQQAMDILDHLKEVLDVQPDSALDRQRDTYKQEIVRLRNILQKDMLNPSQTADKAHQCLWLQNQINH